MLCEADKMPHSPEMFTNDCLTVSTTRIRAASHAARVLPAGSAVNQRARQDIHSLETEATRALTALTLQHYARKSQTTAQNREVFAQI